MRTPFDKTAAPFWAPVLATAGWNPEPRSGEPISPRDYCGLYLEFGPVMGFYLPALF
jgi:hypothetical protein